MSPTPPSSPSLGLPHSQAFKPMELTPKELIKIQEELSSLSLTHRAGLDHWDPAQRHQSALCRSKGGGREAGKPRTGRKGGAVGKGGRLVGEVLLEEVRWEELRKGLKGGS